LRSSGRPSLIRCVPGTQGPRTSGLIFPQCMLNDGDRAIIAAKLEAEPDWNLVVQLHQMLLRDTSNDRVWGPEHPRMRALSEQ